MAFIRSVRVITMGYLDRPNRPNRLLRPASCAALRYGLALVSIAAAFGLAQIFLHFHLPQPFAAFALSAIAIAFWYGGTGGALSRLCLLHWSAPISSNLRRTRSLAFSMTLCFSCLRC
jgi:hypothetical protein